MKKGIHLTLLLFCLNVFNLHSQVVLNELSFGGFLGDFVELKNLGPDPVNISGYHFFTTAPDGVPSSVPMLSLSLGCGSLVLDPGDIIVLDNISDFISWQPGLGDVALYSTNANDFEFPGDLVDYIAWGFTPSTTFTQQVAVAAGQWTSGDFVDGDWFGLSLEYDGIGDASSDWPFNNMPTICAENAAVTNTCEVVAGIPNIGQYDFCVGDGNPDVPTDLVVSGSIGSSTQWVVTDVAGVILELPNSVSEANFETAPGGLCVMWHVTYEDDLVGLEIGGAVLMLQGCHATSTPVLIVRTQVSGGLLEGGPFDFCVGDADPDFISSITRTGNLGETNQWVVTDEQGTILGLPDDISLVDFDLAPPGICSVWNLSYAGSLVGLAVGESAGDLEGCFSLSNPITVNRYGVNSPECGGTNPTNTNYVLVGFDELKLERATVFSGGLGSTDGDLEITEESEVIADGTFVHGPYIRVYGEAKANNIYAIPAEPILPDFIYNETETTNDYDVDVAENEVFVFTESIYEDIDVGDGATITFSGNDFVYIEELDVEDNVTILFDQCTNLIIKKKLSIGKYNNFNPGEQNVFIFIEEEAEVKKGTFFYGGIYTLEKLRIRKADEIAPTTMSGVFIGEDVKARDFVELHFSDVAPCQTSLTGSTPYALSQNQEENPPTEESLENADLVVYPNPANDMAYLNLMTRVEQTGRIQIFDMMNQLVFEKENQTIDGHAIGLDVADFSVGMYTAKITLQDGTSLSQKVIVAR